MKVFILEFSFFYGVSWTMKDITITATSKIQLIKAFISETVYLAGRETRRDIWNKNKSYINEEILTFPIITSKDN